MTKQRSRVVEHRITRVLRKSDAPFDKPITVRWWIEIAPEHGGLLLPSAALLAVEQAEASIKARFDSITPEDLALQFLELVGSANSVEVCDDTGQGIAAHRDWP
jgi:hypothetical protein